jgi:hypothetical protein
LDFGPNYWLAMLSQMFSAVGAVLLLASMGDTPSYAGDFLPGWLLVCIGFALAMPTVTSSGTAELLPDQSATGSALVNASVQIGLVIGISILVAILGTASIAAELHVFRIAWWSAAGIVVGAGCIALGVTPRPKRLKNEGDDDAHPHAWSHRMSEGAPERPQPRR